MQTDGLKVALQSEFFQEMVHKFNSSIKAKQDVDLRIKLIREEAQEFMDAVEAKNVVEALDALCDLLYVVYGAADCLDLGVLDTEVAAQTPASGKDPNWSELHKELDNFMSDVNLVIQTLRQLNNPLTDKAAAEALAGRALESLARGCWACAAEGLGVDLRPFFKEVHRTNMHKLRGPVRDDGKQLKPEGWRPPRLRAMYNRLKAGGPAYCKSFWTSYDNGPKHDISPKRILPHPEGGYFCEECGGLFLEIELDLDMMETKGFHGVNQ